MLLPEDLRDLFYSLDFTADEMALLGRIDQGDTSDPHDGERFQRLTARLSPDERRAVGAWLGGAFDQKDDGSVGTVGDGPGVVIEEVDRYWVNLAALFADESDDTAVVEGLLFAGRWTQLVAAAKMGKSELALSVSHHLARGLEPFTRAPRERLVVAYSDSEMGRLDVRQRLEAAGLVAADLIDWYYTDLPKHLDIVEHSARFLAEVRAIGARVVIFDGLNGFVSKGENEDVPWRDLYALVIAPLKADGVAVLSLDNLGKDVERGARGSSVKADKADVIFRLARTDGGGVLLTRTHTRTGSAAPEIPLTVRGIEGDEPVTYSLALGAGWPAGTRECAAALDELGVALGATQRIAAKALREAGRGCRTAIVSAALSFRKAPNYGDSQGPRNRRAVGNHSGITRFEASGITTGITGNQDDDELF